MYIFILIYLLDLRRSWKWHQLDLRIDRNYFFQSFVAHFFNYTWLKATIESQLDVGTLMKRSHVPIGIRVFN